MAPQPSEESIDPFLMHMGAPQPGIWMENPSNRDLEEFRAARRCPSLVDMLIVLILCD